MAIIHGSEIDSTCLYAHYCSTGSKEMLNPWLCVRIMRVCIRDERRSGEQDWYDAGFQLDDPGRVICSDNKKWAICFVVLYVEVQACELYKIISLHSILNLSHKPRQFFSFSQKESGLLLKLFTECGKFCWSWDWWRWTGNQDP